VVAYLQQNAAQAEICQHGVLFRSFGIPLQQNRAGFVTGLQNERIVVGRLRAGVVTGIRREYTEVHRAQRKRLSSVKTSNLDAEGLSLLEHIHIGGNGRIVANP
jgi:hypothetical protein